MFHYTSCGLRNVWLHNGYAERETEYGESLAIHDLEGLHKAIGLCLANYKPRLSGAEVRFLRIELDMSQQALAKFLGVSVNTLRAWENHRGRITKAPESLLRALYREHVCGDGKVRAFIERINQLDRDGFAERMEFQETERGWNKAA
jgi:DNA-binding transcriptional regulator YiaG